MRVQKLSGYTKGLEHVWRRMSIDMNMCVYLTAPVTCPPNEWQCNSSQCIPSRWRCDGSFDCADKSDELGCPPDHIAPDDQCHSRGEFKCRSSGQCIHQAWVCDSDPDCEDGSDEANCTLSFLFTSQSIVTVKWSMVDLYSTLLWRTTSLKCSDMAHVSYGITQFYLSPTHKPYLPLLTIRRASPPFGWYSLHLPTEGWPGWVDMTGYILR